MKDLRVRRQRWSDELHPARGSGVRSLLADRSSFQRTICHPRARSAALWCVTLWERVVIGRLRVLEWQNVNFSNTEVADKQCGGLQTRVDVGALPTLRAIYKRASVSETTRLDGGVWCRATAQLASRLRHARAPNAAVDR